MTAAPLVAAEAVSAIFRRRTLLRAAPAVRAVDGVSLAVARGEALGVVGESGSGKSTLGRLMLGLLAPSAGHVSFDGRRLDALAAGEWRAMRRRLQIVFQDPYGSLDPRRRVAAQIADGAAIHGLADPEGRVRTMLATVGLDPTHGDRYPHEFSGGQRQRIGIARALSTEPEFLVADEPVASLDVSIQAQILDLLARLRADLGLAMLFISHDLAVVAHLCDRVAVMYLGRVMEEGPARDVLARPRHPYAQALVSATPRIRAGMRAQRIVLPGEPPSPAAPPSGCVFRTRCVHARDVCAAVVPPLVGIGENRSAACIRLNEIG